MEINDLIAQARRISSNTQELSSLFVEALEFLRIYAGERSSFYKEISQITGDWTENYSKEYIVGILRGYIRFLENGLFSGVSLERQVQIDVVTDFLEQADKLLDAKDVHPAAACVLIGASLEEFLRNWIEESSFSIGSNKPSIDTYSKILRERELLTKQDMKDITSWSGLRNHAAHGEWDEVNDKNRVSLMLEGVNLFIRKHGK